MATYFIHQKITAFANQYQIFEADGKESGKLIAFAHQKRLAIKEAFLFYTDETKQQQVFRIKARHIVELAATYDVFDDKDTILGSFKKEFSASILRSSWRLYNAAGDEIASVRERSLPKAIARRIWGFVPILGDVPFLLKYHFDFINNTNQVIGTYNKTTLWRDHYRLDLNEPALDNCDWRVFVAMGVGLDALQSR